MKFILNQDKLEIQNTDNVNSGSVQYYEAEVEYDESWNDLIIEAVIAQKEGGAIIFDEAVSVAVVDNKMYIDRELNGSYAIGFRGFTIENEVKPYQISTNMQGLYFNIGAGQIITTNSIPKLSEWEIYAAQLREITSEINGLADDLEAQVQEVETKLENGDFDGADGITPTIGQNGNWYLGDTDTGMPSRGENGTNRN